MSVSDQPVAITGIAWYSEEEYEEILTLFEKDSSSQLPRTFKDWETKATAKLNEMQGKGYTVVKAEIHPKEFAKWCKDRWINLDSHARTAFANEAAFNFLKNKNMTD